MLRWLAASDWKDIPELTEEKKKTGGIAICQNPDGDKDGSGRPCAANVFRGCPEVQVSQDEESVADSCQASVGL